MKKCKECRRGQAYCKNLCVKCYFKNRWQIIRIPILLEKRKNNLIKKQKRDEKKKKIKCKLCGENNIYCKSKCKNCYYKLVRRGYNTRKKEKISKKHKEYYQKNKESILQRTNLYDKENLKKRFSYRKQRREKNRQELNEYAKYYVKNKRITNINFKIKQYLSTRLFKALKGEHKQEKTITLIGCSIQQLKKHIKSQWLPNMSWDNWAKKGWHIDHIIPCCQFDLSKPEQQRECFHYTNLRPLWATTEIAKEHNTNNIIGNLNRPKK